MLKNIFAATLMTLLLVGCELDEGQGSTVSGKPLPAAGDNSINIFCENMGIHQNRCILDDPENPYRNVNITNENKWDVLKLGSPGNKAKVYFWASTMARNPNGENQYYTAEALTNLYKATKSDDALKEQAIKAHRSVLVNYFSDVVWQDWNDGNGETPKPINALSAAALYNTATNGLFANANKAAGEMMSWGFVYYPASNTVERF